MFAASSSHSLGRCASGFIAAGSDLSTARTSNLSRAADVRSYNVKTRLAALAGVLASVTLVVLAASPSASAHRNVCHTQHTCPSDHHTYRWRKLLCTSYRTERLKSDKIVVHYGGRTYWCHR